MNSKIFENVYCPKPWGWEYLLYTNHNIELWYLYLDKDKRTSLHCHPQKKTGLIVLAGTAEVSFLNDTIKLKSLDKVMIRQGLFHSTTCTSEKLSLLEIETPPDKSDLVRLEDSYGRAGQPYESPDGYIPDFSNIRLTEHDKNYTLDGCNLRVTKKNFEFDDHDIIMVLSGGLQAQDKYVLSSGDIVNAQTYRRLSNVFPIKDLELLVLSKNG